MLDNTKYYDDSFAYDFDLFMPKIKKEKSAKIIKIPRKKSKIKSKVYQKILPCFVIIFTLLLIVFNIFVRACASETFSLVRKEEKKILQLNSEKTILEVKLKSTESYNKLEEKAKDFGMGKAKKEQIVFIHTNDEYIAITSDGKISVANE